MTQNSNRHTVQRLAARCFFCLILAASLTGCSAFRLQQPTVKAGTVTLSALDFQKADLTVEMQVTNPNPTTLVIVGYTYELQVEAQPFLSGVSENEIELKPKDVTTVAVPFSIKFSDLMEKLSALKGKADAGYALSVSLGIKTPVGTYPLSFKKEGRMPVLGIPHVRLRGVRIGALSAQGMSLEALVEVSDPGPSVKLSGLSYALSVNGLQVTAGADDHPQPLPGGDGHLFRIPVLLDSSKARSLLGPLVLGTNQSTFTLTGQATFSSPLGVITLPFTHTQKIKPTR